MNVLMKKHSNFLMWVVLPSLLLVISVFGVNFVSKPGMGGAGQICSTAADCNSFDGFNSCRLFQCVNGICEPAGRANLPGCQQCGLCGNGVCELNAGEGSTCDNSAGQDCAGFGALCFRIGACSGNSQDFCCPDFCTGDPSSSLFDVDCACCGDSLSGNFPGEQCEPSLNNGACNTPNGASGTCDAQCQCTANCGDGNIDPGEQCDPPNGTTCDANCQLIAQQPVCGNGILEAGEACEGTTCSVTQSDGSVVPGVCQNCQCLPECVTEGSGCGNNGGTQTPCFAGTGGTGGSSLIPPPVHPTVLAQWLATFSAPGLLFAGLRIRRKRR